MRRHYGNAFILAGEPIARGTFDAVTLDEAIGRREEALAKIGTLHKTGHASPAIANDNGVRRRANGLAPARTAKRISIGAAPAIIGDDGVVRTRP